MYLFFWNYDLMNFSNHIGIIGSGISGLTLAYALKKIGIDVVLFERSKEVSEYGAGISISRNALKILDHLDLISLLREKSYQPKTVSWKYKNNEFHYTSTDVFTASRKNLIKVLYEEYIKLGGEILYDHEVCDITENGKVLHFTNKNNCNIKHIAACDGIKSSVRNKYFTDSSDIKYSGFNAWRGIVKSNNTKVQFHLGAKTHIVQYPINNELDQSFVAVVKDKNWNKESWKQEGTIQNFYDEFPDAKEVIFLENQKVFKWGIFIRPPLNKIFRENMTLLGDSAHPMVPFMGQGGCMAIEDAYTFAQLLKKLNLDFATAQYLYNKIRVNRNNKIQKMSMRQARLNHIENHFIASVRNTLMKNTNVISNRANIIWNYDAHEHIESELRKL